MTETANIVCPNCGANITNRSNCEYCGSLLVRFVDKGIDLSQTTYFNDDAVFLGLREALNYNLQIQNSITETVATDIYRSSGTNLASVIRSGHAIWADGTTINLANSLKGLCIIFGFYNKYATISKEEHSNKVQEALHNRFKSLSSFQLFSMHKSFISENNMTFYEYAIDFGCDYVNAARILSEVLSKVYLVSLDTKLDYHTNFGIQIDMDRTAILEQREAKQTWKAPQEITDTDDFSWIAYPIGAALFYLLYNIFLD